MYEVTWGEFLILFSTELELDKGDPLGGFDVSMRTQWEKS